MTEEYTNTDVTNWIDQVSFTKLPPDFNNMRSPWRVSRRVNNCETINRLLAQSFVVQSSTIPFPVTHPNLPFFILSNSCIQISNLIKYYLSHLEVEAEVHCGALTLDGIRGIMHVFLEIEGEIVDNTYVHSEEEDCAQTNLDNYLMGFGPRFKLPERYDKRPRSETTLQIQGDEKSDLEFSFMEVTCESDFNMRKSAAIAIKTSHCGIGTLVYDKLMRHWIKTELGVEIPCVTEIMDKVCWACEEDNEGLKSCQKCLVAKYCWQGCQVKDWKEGHKLMHKIIDRGFDSLHSRQNPPRKQKNRKKK